MSAVDCPAQVEDGGVTETIGEGLTTTVTCADAVHPFKFPVTVYVVVVSGLALTLAPVGELNDHQGDHE